MCRYIEDTDLKEVIGYKVVIKQMIPSHENIVRYYSPFTGVEYLQDGNITPVSTNNKVRRCEGVNHKILDTKSPFYTTKMTGRTGIFKYLHQASQLKNSLTDQNYNVDFVILKIKLYVGKTNLSICTAIMEFSTAEDWIDADTYIGPCMKIIEEID